MLRSSQLNECFGILVIMSRPKKIKFLSDKDTFTIDFISRDELIVGWVSKHEMYELISRAKKHSDG